MITVPVCCRAVCSNADWRDSVFSWSECTCSMNGCAFVLLARWCVPDWRSCRWKQKSYLVTSEAGESWCMQSVCVLHMSSSDLVLILFPLFVYTMLVTASELALSASLIHISGIYSYQYAWSPVSSHFQTSSQNALFSVSLRHPLATRPPKCCDYF